MAHKINPNACVACGACADTCPERAISEKPPVFVINPEACIDCGACIDACPNGAVKAGG